MNITKDFVVEMDYILTDKNGNVLDASEKGEPLAYLHGHQNIVPGLEKELEGRKANDSFKVTVTPEEGYGPKRDELLKEVPKADLSGIPDLEVGLQLQADTPYGVQVFEVTEIKGDTVVLDGNHPLAGEELNFDIKILSVRVATSEELTHGHAHGPHGHHH